MSGREERGEKSGRYHNSNRNDLSECSSGRNHYRSRERSSDRYRDRDGDRYRNRERDTRRYSSRGSDRIEKQRNHDNYSFSSRRKPIPIDLRPSGILTKYLDTTTKSSSAISSNGIKSKYAPPKDEIIPTSDTCKFHLFKYNEKTDKQIEIPLFNFKSFFIFGRNSELSDIILSDEEDGDLLSKQHAVLQFKQLNGIVKCYLIDIGSTNGTFLNDDKVELPKKRYIELKNNDVFKLGDYESIIEFMVIEDK